MNSVVIFVMALMTWALEALLIKLFWGWFVLPAFGRPAPSYLLCAGLSLFFSVLVSSVREDETHYTEEKQLWRINHQLFVLLPSALFLGFILHLIIRYLG